MFHNASLSLREYNKIISRGEKKKKRKNNKKETIYKINKNHYFLEKYYKFFFDRRIERLLQSTRSTVFSSIYLSISSSRSPLFFRKQTTTFYISFFPSFSFLDPRDRPIKTRCSPRNDGSDENFDACPSCDSSSSYCCACRLSRLCRKCDGCTRCRCRNCCPADLDTACRK